jgi:hypothetical protein
MTTLVDTLLANTGLYVGRGWFAPDERPPRASRLVVTALPGASGVTLDYEVMSMQGESLHREHSMLARSSDGNTILVVAHQDDTAVAILGEMTPGFFTMPRRDPYPKGQMGIRIDVPEPGRVRHAYCWADEQGRFGEVDVSDLRIVG